MNVFLRHLFRLQASFSVVWGVLLSLPTQYLVSGKSIPDFLAAIQNAKAPERFTQSFLEALGFKSTNDRLFIGMLKALRFLDEAGKPTQTYFDFLDQTRGDVILAQAIRDAYSDLFAINVNAQAMPKSEFIGKVKTLMQGQVSDLVLDRMWLTFSSLVKAADFTTLKNVVVERDVIPDSKPADPRDPPEPRFSDATVRKDPAAAVALGGLIYNIELHLPESRDKAVYDVLFRSLREHLL